MDHRQIYKEEITQLSESKKGDAVKEHFKITVETKFKTSFIHAIAQMEQIFGHLWDPNSENIEVEGPEFYRELFESFRKSVLDNGNKQIRSFRSDMDHYDMRLKGNKNVE